MMNNLRPILLVHSDPGELRLIRRQLLEAGVENPVVPLQGTEAAIDFLDAVCIASSPDDRFRPCLLLIDDTVPTADVRQVIDWAGRQALVADLRIVILSDAWPGNSLEPRFRKQDQRLICCARPVEIAALARTECHPEPSAV
jgi:hypothetical protein